MADVIIYRSAVLLHRVRHLMVFVATPFGGKETVLTHIKVETLEAAVAETTDWRRLQIRVDNLFTKPLKIGIRILINFDEIIEISGGVPKLKRFKLSTDLSNLFQINLTKIKL